MTDVAHLPECPCCGADGHALESPAVTAPRLSRRRAIQTGAGLVAAGSAARLLGAERVDATAVSVPRWPAPPIVARATWGANERMRNGSPVYDSKVEKLVVHHTATPNGRGNPSALVRNVYTYHLARSYIDLAYNFVIDSAGVIYEGRWAADYARGAVHTGENAKGQQVRGAHSLYHNDRTIGIALLGTYDAAVPTNAMMQSLVDVLTWKCARWNIDPVGRSVYMNSNRTRVTIPNIIGHRDVRPTLCPGGKTHALLPSVRAQVQQKLAAGARAYWVVARNGRVLANGVANPVNDARAQANGVIGACAPTGGDGAWLLTPNGGVVAVAGARHYGDASKLQLQRPPVGIASSASGRGYFVVASDGGVFTFGDAQFKGSMGGRRLAAPVIAIAASPSGGGYWMLARDGGVFSFGDAKFSGSAAPLPASDPAVAMLVTKTGLGYWILQRSGAIRAFGDAPAIQWASRATGPVVGLHRAGGGLIALGANGTFARSPSAPPMTAVSARLRGAPAVAIVGAP